MAEFSIILAGKGGNLCNMGCHYCSATGVSKKDSPGCKEWPIVIDYDAMFKTMDANPTFKEHRGPDKNLVLNLWGGDPLMHTKYWDEMLPKIREHYPDLNFKIFISTNGLLLGAKHIQDWIYDAHKKWGLEMQISHDGVGQYVRSGKFDPFYDPKTKDVVVKMVRSGILTMINATLNQYNCSPLANFAYFQKWRYENHLENTPLYLIKINHNNDAEYTGPFRLRGENLKRYMDEMQTLWFQSMTASKDDPYWKPYIEYFDNQMTRWKKVNNRNDALGGCGRFSVGLVDTTWCMNTKGEYVFCQLCNDPNDNPNPNCESAKVCEHCEFRNMHDCIPCPAMVQSEDCEYKKEYIRAVLRMKPIYETYHNMLNTIQNQSNIIRNLEGQLNNNACNYKK